MKPLKLFAIAIFLFSLIGCNEGDTVNTPPTVPKEVEPFLAKTLEKYSDERFRVLALESESLDEKSGERTSSSTKVRLFLFADRRVDLEVTKMKVSGGLSPLPLTLNKSSRWSYHEGIIEIEEIGEFRITGSSGTLYMFENVDTLGVNANTATTGIPLTMQEILVEKDFK